MGEAVPLQPRNGPRSQARPWTLLWLPSLCTPRAQPFSQPSPKPSPQPSTPTPSLVPRPITAAPKPSEELPAEQALPWTGPRSPRAGQRPTGARAAAGGQAAAPGEGACSPGTPSPTCPAQAGMSAPRVAGEAPGTCGGQGHTASRLLPVLREECPSAQGHTERQDSNTALSSSKSAFTNYVYSKRTYWCWVPCSLTECGPQTRSLSPS